MENEFARLNWTVVTEQPGFSGVCFYLTPGSDFDLGDFSEWVGEKRPFDSDDVHAVQDAAAGLCEGQYLVIDLASE